MGSGQAPTDTAATAAIATTTSAGTASDTAKQPAGGAPTATVRAHKVQFDALRNAVYHTSRRGFLDMVTRSLNFVVVAGGTGAVADIGASIGFGPAWFAGLAAVAGLAQLVFDFGGRARTHEFLQRRFYEVSAEISRCLAATDEDCARWEADLHRLYAEEPPPMRALDAIAYNAAVDALGRGDENRLVIGRKHSLFRHLWAFNGTSFVPVGTR